MCFALLFVVCLSVKGSREAKKATLDAIFVVIQLRVIDDLYTYVYRSSITRNCIYVL